MFIKDNSTAKTIDFYTKNNHPKAIRHLMGCVAPQLGEFLNGSKSPDFSGKTLLVESGAGKSNAAAFIKDLESRVKQLESQLVSSSFVVKNTQNEVN